MSTTAGPGPGYRDRPDHHVGFEPTAKRIRVVFGGETLVDTTRGLILFETGHLPVYYLPRDDAAMDRLTKTDRTTHCPFKGDASYYTVEAGGRRAENAVWSYELPFDEVEGIGGHLAFYWDRMDHWYEEDEEVFVHPRSPYVRIDILDSSRPLRIVLGGETVAETSRARFLFETGLPVRRYIPREDVRAELLPSDHETGCPYKGRARYHSVRAGGQLFENIVWTHPEPFREAERVRGYLCFYDEKVDAVFVDGVEQERPRSGRS